MVAGRYSTVMVSKKVNLFVYGTLLQGEPFHHLLGGAPLLQSLRSPPEFTLVNLGEYPGMLEGGDTAIYGEIYEIDEALLPTLDEYEDCPTLYYRRSVSFQNGISAITYLLQPSPRTFPAIASGDWRELSEPLPQH